MTRLLVLALAGVQSLLAAAYVFGDGGLSTPVVLRITEEHGVHAGDLPVIALWAVGMTITARLWSRLDEG